MQILENMKDSTTGLATPVVKIKAQHSSPAAAKAKPDKAEQLEPELFLAKGCKIMLDHNLWTEKGLVNGSLGNIVDIIYKPGETSPYHIPAVLICNFPGNTGPGLGPDNLVPIPTVSASWSDNNTSHTRNQFPVVVCYACTIYKSQRLTLNKVNTTNILNENVTLFLHTFSFAGKN